MKMTKSSIRSSRRIVSDDENMGAVEVDPEATELLFEAEDVAELVSQITGNDVEVAVNDDSTVDFTVGDDTYTVAADGDEELLEASTRVLRGTQRRVAASATRRSEMASKRPALANTKVSARRVGKRVR